MLGRERREMGYKGGSKKLSPLELHVCDQGYDSSFWGCEAEDYDKIRGIEWRNCIMGRFLSDYKIYPKYREC